MRCAAGISYLGRAGNHPLTLVHNRLTSSTTETPSELLCKVSLTALGRGGQAQRCGWSKDIISEIHPPPTTGCTCANIFYIYQGFRKDPFLETSVK